MKSLPAIAIKLTHICNGWIVGSAANPENVSPRDIDILIPFRNWNVASSLIPSDAKPNTFGGWKFTSKGVEFDVWPGDLDQLLLNDKAELAWHPQSGIRLKKY